MNFAARLKQLRERARLTQRELAQKSYVKLSALRHWEHGTREPRFTAVAKLARALGVDCGSFLTETEPPPWDKPARPEKTLRLALVRGRFACRLYDLRLARGLTQAQLAERAGMSRTVVAHLEQGQREPAWSAAVSLAKALDANLEMFLVEPTVRRKLRRIRPKKVQQGAE